MKSSLLVFAACLMLAGCSAPPKTTSLPPKTAVPGDPSVEENALTDVPDIGGFKLAAPIEYGNMTFIPVVSTRDVIKQDVDYATLVEAKKNGWIVITELPGGEVVEKLHVRNDGPKPILLLGGELLLGGKQDRIVAHDVVIPPNTAVDVDVYCVEHGRWEGDKRSFEPKMQFAPDRVRKAATYEDQAKVWDNVSGYNSAVGGVPMDKSTVDAGMSNPRVQQTIKEGVSMVMNELRGQSNVVGMLVASDGQVHTLELFGNPKLFKAASEPLLSSFLSEVAVSKNAKAKRVAMDDAAKFVSDTLNSKRRLKSESLAANGFSVSSPAAQISGRELAGTNYEAKPGASADGLIHGTYKKGN